ncbi:hypothetical protein BD289DRAFT_195066 [Coniella lustricola]|uniref:NADH dehydrogenase [ubiquinone] 1 alpha subcomplex subunit 1 n=1 Tax=Coniella lustricola TaxID=2025994 RepID=A0A2T3AM42_9PEZI|nr:hypothetical protein BD289DRAFT_195066 [Coniella lustricola]
MPVPFETFLPYAIVFTMFGVTGAGVGFVKYKANGNKRARRSLDQWDRQMMNRDLRMTGHLRGQSDLPVAPPGYELSHPWRACREAHGLNSLHCHRRLSRKLKAESRRKAR